MALTINQWLKKEINHQEYEDREINQLGLSENDKEYVVQALVLPEKLETYIEQNREAKIVYGSMSSHQWALKLHIIFENAQMAVKNNENLATKVEATKNNVLKKIEDICEAKMSSKEMSGKKVLDVLGIHNNIFSIMNGGQACYVGCQEKQMQSYAYFLSVANQYGVENEQTKKARDEFKVVFREYCSDKNVRMVEGKKKIFEDMITAVPEMSNRVKEQLVDYIKLND